ncbi:hypothetical protein FOL47_003528 [Perkinsus chesapeaki]|uniref:Ankyrin Repeat Protein n=1 Tax=Perkinsus chesapeaki TaxID=330153 RepID=A0A7J6N0F6_PERCH|nr:hypothetical protein FOL47_003528 [Perkinsus chesapeaki]
MSSSSSHCRLNNTNTTNSQSSPFNHHKNVGLPPPEVHFLDPTAFGSLVWGYLHVQDWGVLAQCCRQVRQWSLMVAETSRALRQPQWMPHCCCITALARAVKQNPLAAGALALRMALDPQQILAAGDSDGRSLLDILIEERLYGLANRLVLCGPSACRTTKLTVEAMMAAIYRGDVCAVNILSRSGIDLGAISSIAVEVSSSGGLSQQLISSMDPLSLAVCTGRLHVLEILLGAGAEPSVQSLAWAIDRREPYMLKLLLQHTPSPLPPNMHFLLHMATAAGLCDCIVALLSAGCDVNEENWDGMRPLDLCVRQSKTHGLIHSRGGLHSLRYAASGNNTELIQTVLRREFTGRDYKDRTPEEQHRLDWHLVAASATGSKIAVEALLDWGANPAAVISSASPPSWTNLTEEGVGDYRYLGGPQRRGPMDPIPLREFCMTALHAAACRGHSTVCDILMSHPRTKMWAKTHGGPAVHHQAARLARESLWWNPLVEGPNRSPVMLSNRGRVASELAWEAGYSKLASKLAWEMIIRKVCDEADAASNSEDGATMPKVATSKLVKPAQIPTSAA